MKSETSMIAWLCNIFAGVMTAVQVEETLRIIQLVMTIVATLLSTTISVISMYRVFKANDGKIDADEKKELIEEAVKGLEALKEDIENESNRKDR